MYELAIIITVAIIGLLSHLAKNHLFLERFLRFIILSVALYEAWIAIQRAQQKLYFSSDNYATTILFTTSLLTILILFISFRRILSWIITVVNLIITGQILAPFVFKNRKAIEFFSLKRIFIANSFSHIIALFVYITTAAYTLICNASHISTIPYLPNSLVVRQLLSYGGIAFTTLALCGVGIFIARSSKTIRQRLSLLKPNKINITLGVFIIFASFVYDWYWIVYTHHLSGQDIAFRLSYYNSETFTLCNSFLLSVIFAMLASACAAAGEEILIRGALQPVFGILPAALMHGLLHGQFAHNNIFVVQVTIWSLFLGLVKRYTNTSTTIIGHAGFNMFTILLYALNP